MNKEKKIFKIFASKQDAEKADLHDYAHMSIEDKLAELINILKTGNEGNFHIKRIVTKYPRGFS